MEKSQKLPMQPHSNTEHSNPERVNKEGFPVAMGKVICNVNACAGCCTCEAVCSLSHEGVVSPNLSRIRVINSPAKSWREEAFTCRQCDYPECMQACPTGALHIDKSTCARVIDEAECSGCMLCMEACPLYPNSPIHFKAEDGVCFKCDLCGGDPRCVFYCPEDALTFVRLFHDSEEGG